MSDYLAGQLPPGASVVESIDCGVDTERFTPDGWEPGEGPRFLFVGSLIERKNVGRLAGGVRDGRPGTLDGGRRRPAARSSWLQSPRRECASPAGSIAPAVTAELHRADALVVPSLVEPQGQVVLEALACGCRWSPHASAAQPR